MQITTIKGQTLQDIAAQYYGSTDQSVINELISLNKNLLKNDFTFVESFVYNAYFYIDIPIMQSTTLTVDETSENRNDFALKNMTGNTILTYGS